MNPSVCNSGAPAMTMSYGDCLQAGLIPPYRPVSCAEGYYCEGWGIDSGRCCPIGDNPPATGMDEWNMLLI